MNHKPVTFTNINCHTTETLMHNLTKAITLFINIWGLGVGHADCPSYLYHKHARDYT